MSENKNIVTLDQIGGGLAANGGGKPQGFTFASVDKKFVQADARIFGDTVETTGVKHPVAVRHAWVFNPNANLANQEGLPVSPSWGRPEVLNIVTASRIRERWPTSS